MGAGDGQVEASPSHSPVWLGLIHMVDHVWAVRSARSTRSADNVWVHASRGGAGCCWAAAGSRRRPSESGQEREHLDDSATQSVFILDMGLTSLAQHRLTFVGCSSACGHIEALRALTAPAQRPSGHGRCCECRKIS